MPPVTEPTAREIFEQYRSTVHLLADAARRYQQAQAEVAVLSVERERLWKAVEEAVSREAGAEVAETGEGGAEGLTEALRGIPEPVDLG